MNVAVLFIFIFVVGIQTHINKTDSETTKTMKRIARWTLTATLVLVVIMASFALIATRGNR